MSIEATAGPGYRAGAGWDAAVAAGGDATNDQWRYIIRSFAELGPRELAAREEEAARLLREDGATYHPHDQPSRPWLLDPVPLLVQSDEWARIEGGLLQRAELLDAVLVDIYGPQTLIARGLLPAQLVFGHEGYVRACHGVKLRGPRELITYAADLTRLPGGDVVVMADRAQAPSGSGFALENRRVLSRVLPSLFRDAHVHRLAGYFRALRATLTDLAGHRDAEPRVVILTPGSLSETYFEHAYLASYLGYSLVEGPDLTVRHGRVWLRSLGGLEPVDVILRRVDDTWCDPLELRPESHLGVAGMVEAARRGNVAIANPLGSGILESAALLPFLPAVAKHVLGQDLRLASVPTWWCGDDLARSHVLAHLQSMVLKPVTREPGSRPVFGALLDAAGREDLRSRLCTEGHRWVAQAHLEAATSPALVGGELVARATMLRAFLVARGDSYVVMPGGLTRVGADQDAIEVSNLTGATSKDTWVLASEPEHQVSLWLDTHLDRADEDAGSVPSRTGENLYWLGRYLERAEGMIRLSRVTLARLDEPDASGDGAAVRRRLLDALGRMTDMDIGLSGADDDVVLALRPASLMQMLLDPMQPGSLTGTLRAMVGAAHAVRDRLSSDTWRVVNDVEQQLSLVGRPGVSAIAVRRELDRVLSSLLALAGLVNESMVRGPGWRFLDAGRRLERAHAAASVLEATLVPAEAERVETAVGELVLASAESLVAYRRRYRSHLSTDLVLELLLADPQNPRSLRFQLDRLTDDVAGLAGNPGRRLPEEQRLVLDASARLALADPVLLAGVTARTGRRESLAELLDGLRVLLRATSDVITRTYFTHPGATQVVLGAPAEGQL